MSRKSRGLGRYLSYALRHNPGELGLELAPGGWVPTAALLAALQARRPRLTAEDLEETIREDGKRRFSTSTDGALVRANQGHSVPVDLQLEAREPPATLWHGTTEEAAASIRTEGIRKMGRHHVHLSADPETALRVARRRPRPAVLRVRAGEMAAAGHRFYLSDNGVWLTDTVPPKYVEHDEAQP